MTAAKDFKYKNLIKQLKTKELCTILEQNAVGDCCDVIRSQRIDGEEFLSLTEGQVKLWIHKYKKPELNRLLKVIELANSNSEKFYEGNKSQETKNIKQPTIKTFQITSHQDDDENIYGNQDIIKKFNNEDGNCDSESIEQEEEIEYGNQEIIQALNSPPKPNAYKQLITPKPFNAQDNSKSKSLKHISTPQPLKNNSKLQSLKNNPPPKSIPSAKINDIKMELSNVRSKINQKTFNSTNKTPNPPFKPKPTPERNEFTLEKKNSIEKRTGAIKKSNASIPKSNEIKPKINEPQNKLLNNNSNEDSQYLTMTGNFKQAQSALHEIKNCYICYSSDEDIEDVEKFLTDIELPKPPKAKNIYSYDVLNTVTKNKCSVNKIKNISKDETNSNIKKKFPSYKAKSNIINQPLPPVPREKKSNGPPPRPDITKSNVILSSKSLTSQDEENNLSENIYDPISYNFDDYKCAPWYHEVNRQEAIKLLKNKPNGSFIVRLSSKQTYLCTLTILYSNKIYNLGINQDEHGLLTIGSNGLKKTFKSVNEMIDYYSEHEFSLLYDGEDVYVKLYNFNV